MTDPLILFDVIVGDRRVDTIVGPDLPCPSCQVVHHPTPRGDKWRSGECFDIDCPCGAGIGVGVHVIDLAACRVGAPTVPESGGEE
jgi:hypothetical protein